MAVSEEIRRSSGRAKLVDSGRQGIQIKFHTLRWRSGEVGRTVFAHESSGRSARFDLENRPY